MYMHTKRAITISLAALAITAGTAAAKQGPVVEVDDLANVAPADWTEQPAKGMGRHKQFELKPAKADNHPTELVIFHFGKGSGGNAADNVARWTKMFEDAKPPKVTEETIAGAKATIVEIQGTYLQRSRPMDTSIPPDKRPSHRMIGVVLETANGPYFFRLVGPEGTVEWHKKPFLVWLRGLKKK
jgi:hypothetical protein